MDINYKKLESCPLPIIRYRQVQQSLNEEKIKEPPQNNEEIIQYLDPDAFLEFLEAFHIGVSTKNSNTITDLLYTFFSNISYLDKDSNECKLMLLDYSLFEEQTPIIVDDIIYCLKIKDDIEVHRSVLELIEYISDQSLFFIDLFLQKGGIDHIISLVKVLAEEEILLKSIQLLGELSSNKRSHQKLVNDDFFRTFVTICCTLFKVSDRFKKTFDQMVYYCSILLRQIIGIVVSQFDQEPDSLPQLTESEKYRIKCQQEQQSQIKQQNINNIINPGTYKIIWNFYANKYFFQNPNFSYSQEKAIETFQLLCTDHYFIKNIFPYILHYIPLMVQKNLLILQNKIKIYQLITMVYETAPKFEALIYCIEPNQSKGKQKISFWDILIESLSSENKKEIFAALNVFKALFSYNPNSIGIALQKNLHNILTEMVENCPYNVKVKALQTIYLWISCNNIEAYNEPFINLEFLDFLFPFLETEDEKMNDITSQVILLIFSLNFRFNNIDQKSIDFYRERYNEILRNPNI